ncbi:MAG TPA: DinB family protein [Chitinophagaceae bacterium]|nr:DinB family protein [Chitinophagaceae bacterium]
MLKRTKGRILLATLVITGLAGTVKNTTLSSQERKFAVSQLRETKTDLLKSIRGLTTVQLNFRINPEKWSIKEHLEHIAVAEKALWGKLETAMKKPAAPEKRHLVKMSDIDVVEAVSGENPYGLYAGFVQPVDISWASHSEAANIFKSSRSKHLKYIKTTTGDLRNRFIHLSLGWVDCYQFILFMTAYCDGHIRQIQDILSDPRFPAQ